MLGHVGQLCPQEGAKGTFVIMIHNLVLVTVFLVCFLLVFQNPVKWSVFLYHLILYIFLILCLCSTLSLWYQWWSKGFGVFSSSLNLLKDYVTPFCNTFYNTSLFPKWTSCWSWEWQDWEDPLWTFEPKTVSGQYKVRPARDCVCV